VRPQNLDDAIAAVVTQMPVGAISNPIRVPGGYTIVTLAAKRTIGLELVTMANVRQAFFPFTSVLNPAAPTDQQKSMLLRARNLSATAHDCATMEATNKEMGTIHPSDPGLLPLERLSNPAMKQLLGSLEINKPSQPLVSNDGILVMMVCSKKQENLAQTSRSDMGDRIVNERVERLARRLQQDMERQANIKRYGVAAQDGSQS
jgi:peptidyl-prolyl cis-trans isomerase SurA